MLLSDFDFALPEERIALHPARPRDAARLLVVRDDGLSDAVVRDLPGFLRAGDVMVFNDTRVIPAQLVGRRGGVDVALTLLRPEGDGRWSALARPARRLKPGDVVELEIERIGVTIQRVITDNGLAFRSAAFASACLELGISQKFTRAYRPQTNGKAERFIQSALREWAYGRAYANSGARQFALAAWTHYYNWHRPHHGINLVPPVHRLSVPRKNLLTLHT